MSTANFRPTALSEQLYQELKKRVLTCVLKPGHHLVEKHLCEDLGVSRTSLREALNRLAQEKLLTQRPNVGFHVTPITPDRFRNICELRRVLESQVAGLAAGRADAEAIAAMRIAARLDVDPNDPDAYITYVEENFAFHHAVARAAGNPLLEELVVSALEKDQQPIYYGIDLEVCTNPADISAEHLAIVAAIEARDAPEASRLMTAHIGKKEQRIARAAIPQ